MTIPESPTPTPSPTLTPTPKKSNSTVWIIVAIVAVILICCILLAVVAGAFFVFNRRTGSPSNIPMPFLPTPLQVQPAPTQQGQPAPTQPAPTGSLVVQSFDPTSSNYPALPDLIPSWSELSAPGSQNWTVSVPANQPVLILLGWCTQTSQILQQNDQHIKWTLTVDGQSVDVQKLFAFNQQLPDRVCSSYSGLIRQWPGSSHKIVTTMTVDQQINDGWNNYVAGDYTDVYTVTVTP